MATYYLLTIQITCTILRQKEVLMTGEVFELKGIWEKNRRTNLHTTLVAAHILTLPVKAISILQWGPKDKKEDYKELSLKCNIIVRRKANRCNTMFFYYFYRNDNFFHGAYVVKINNLMATAFEDSVIQW